MVRHLATALALLIVIASANHTYARDNRLDPGPITWWQDTWTPRPIELSRSNASSTGVTLKIMFRPSTSITNGVVEIGYPTSLTVTGGTAGIWQTSKSLVKDTDTSVTLTGITLPSTAGLSGFSVVTRESATGQIIDANFSFGAIYVTAAEEVLTTLSVESASSSQVQLLKKETLTFSFNLAFDVWPYDVYAIKGNAYWTIPDSPECESVDPGSGNTNLFTSRDGSNILDCVADTSGNIVYIYGMSNYIDVSQANVNKTVNVKIKIGDYTSPKANYASSNYSWTLSILRWGTRDIVKAYTGSGPSTNAGLLTITRWSSHNGFTNIIQNLSVFTDVEFTTTNPIESSGIIKLTFTGTVTGASFPSGNYGCYLPTTLATCTATASEVQITTTQSIAKNSSFSFTVLTNFSNSSASVTATSYLQDGTTVIDTTASAVSIAYVAGHTKLEDFDFELRVANDGTGADINTTGNTTGMYLLASCLFSSTAALGTAVTSSVQFHLPFNHDSLSHYEYLINNGSSTTNSFKAGFGTDTTADATLYYTSNTNGPYATTTANNLITTTSALTLTGATKAAFGFFNYVNNAATTLTAPLVATNKATRYETWVLITVGSTVYVGVQQFDLQAASFASTVVTQACNTVVDFLFDMPYDVATSGNSTRSYYLAVEFTGHSSDLGSGLTAGEAYPYYSVETSFTATATLGEKKIVFAGIPNLNTTTNHRIYTVVGAYNGTNTAKVYYQDSNHPNVEFVIVSTTSAAYNIALATANIQIDASQTPVAGALLNPVITQDASYTLAPIQNIFVIQFPQGYTFENPTLEFATNIYPAIALSSTNILFKLPTLLLARAVGANDLVTASGVRAAPYELAATPVYFGMYYNSAQNDNCKVTSSTTLTTNKGTITTISFSPNTIKGRGPNSYLANIEVRFLTINGIPQGGSIEVGLATQWQASSVSPSCSISGATGTAAFASSKCTVTNISAFPSSGYITITFMNMLPPQYSSGTPNVPHITTITTKTAGGVSIDEYPTQATQLCVVTPADPTGKTTIKAATKTIPTNLAVDSADLYLRFNVNNVIPSGGKIEITAPAQSWSTPTAKSNDYITFSKKYSSVSVSSNNLSITTAEMILPNEELELYVDDALVTSSGDSGFFVLKTSFDGITLDQDDAQSPLSSAKLVTTEANTNSMTPGTGFVAIDTTTANQYADYTFSFSSVVASQQGDEIWIKFPHAYNPLIGKVHSKYPNSNEGVYLIDCSSSSLFDTLTECAVDHWYVKVRNPKTFGANSSLDLIVSNVMNPAFTSNQDGSFKIFHMTSNGMARAFSTGLSRPTLTDMPPNIKVRSITPSTHSMFSTADYKFEVYLGLDLTGDDQIRLHVPPEFQLDRVENVDQYGCTLNYINHSDESTSLDEVEVTGITNCSVDGNWVVMDIPVASTTQSFTFSPATTRVVYRLQQFPTIQWGQVREKTIANILYYDGFDDDVFTIYDKWTGPFTMSIYDATNKVHRAISYLDVNANYLGFNRKIRWFTVNNYSPNTPGSHIVVNPGTQTGRITIATNDLKHLAAQQAVFTPATNVANQEAIQFTYTSVKNNFTMYNTQSQITFRISTPIDSIPGRYYINWEVEETNLSSSSEPKYDPPVKTLVEVTEITKLDFTVASIPTVKIGTTTNPISIMIERPPHSQVQVEISSSSSQITISPSTLTFRPEDTIKRFTVSVSSEFDTIVSSGKQQLSFTISGTDAQAFNSIPVKKFNVTSEPQEGSGLITSLVVNDPTRTSAEIKSTANVNGVIYWYTAADNTASPTTDQILTAVGDIFELESELEDTTEATPEIEPSSADESNSRLEPWVAFKRRLYEEAILKTYFGAAVCAEFQETVIGTVTGLYAETNYQTWAFVDNGAETYSPLVDTTWRTDDMPSSALFRITIDVVVGSEYDNDIRQSVASVLGLPVSNLLDLTRTSSRRLQQGIITSTTYELIIPADRSVQSPTPADLANINADTDRKSELEGLIKAKVSGLSSDPIFSYFELSRASYSTPSWTVSGAPSVVTQTESSITSEMQCSTLGEICGQCVANTVNNDEVTADQILLGLDSSGNATASTCVNYLDTGVKASIEITGLAVNTQYKCYYMCYNDYPVWPNAIDESPISYLVGSTVVVQEEEDDDFSMNIGVWMAVLFGVLVQ